MLELGRTSLEENKHNGGTAYSYIDTETAIEKVRTETARFQVVRRIYGQLHYPEYELHPGFVSDLEAALENATEKLKQKKII